MSIDEVVKKIVFIPSRLNDIKNASAYSLLKESGYFEIYNQINEILIMRMLSNSPKVVDDWLQWSENKRTSSGWFINKGESGKYRVAFFPMSKNFPLVEYSDVLEACSAFIKREIENIRQS